jgi:hypothetical protein
MQASSCAHHRPCDPSEFTSKVLSTLVGEPPLHLLSEPCAMSQRSQQIFKYSLSQNLLVNFDLPRRCAAHYRSIISAFGSPDFPQSNQVFVKIGIERVSECRSYNEIQDYRYYDCPPCELETVFSVMICPSKQVRFSSRYLEVDLGDARREEVVPKALLPPLREDMRLLALARREKGGNHGSDNWEKGRTYLTCCVRLSEEKNAVSLNLEEMSIYQYVCIVGTCFGKIGLWNWACPLGALLRQLAK